MDTWTLQTGFPVVTVERDYDNNAATISQVAILCDFLRRNLRRYQRIS
jgi:aminopeptidase N